MLRKKKDEWIVGEIVERVGLKDLVVKFSILFWVNYLVKFIFSFVK